MAAVVPVLPARALCPDKVPAVLDVLTTKSLLCSELIVRATTDAEIRDIVCAAVRPWLDVIELEERSRITATTVGGNVATL